MKCFIYICGNLNSTTIKRLLSFFICLLLAVAAFAQNADEHLKFMGIPIADSLSNFEKKLEDKGFAFEDVFSDSIRANIREYKGLFTGRMVSVYVVSSYDIVWKIEVKYSDYKSFSNIEKDYKTMVEQYSIKYGDNFEHLEIFTDQENYLDDDDYKLQQLKQGQCFYIAGWILKQGLIAIKINVDASLRIVYEDAESQKKTEQYNKQIQDDI